MNPSSDHVSRRTLIAGSAAAAAALLPLQAANAQVAAQGGTWIAMVQAQHKLVAKTFDALLGSADRTFLRRRALQRTLAYQLTAHSVAEENVLYPALAMNGLVSESDQLYLDQAHVKVMNAQVELTRVEDEAAWTGKVKALRDLVLRHATEDEENRLFPMLAQKLDAEGSAKLSAAFAREFASVRPAPDLVG